jgi:hypothetical protein
MLADLLEFGQLRATLAGLHGPCALCAFFRLRQRGRGIGARIYVSANFYPELSVGNAARYALSQESRRAAKPSYLPIANRAAIL